MSKKMSLSSQPATKSYDSKKQSESQAFDPELSPLLYDVPNTCDSRGCTFASGKAHENAIFVVLGVHVVSDLKNFDLFQMVYICKRQSARIY